MAEKYLTDNPALEIDTTVEKFDPDKVIVVTDINVKRDVLPLLHESRVLKNATLITVTPGEDYKNLTTVTSIWNKLEECGATRRSLLINIGGGVVTDMGGFAAATFKRGIRTINFPTTLLGAVDAASGGKTGINFNGLKNEIGAFHMPSKVIISPVPFATLSQLEILSGYAEMIKTAIISDASFYLNLLDIDNVTGNPEILGKAVAQCVAVKDDIVAQDPHEKGLRKVLNFGHTAGHAFESLRFEKGIPVPHGNAVAHGMLVALILSHIVLGFESYEINQYRNFLRENYGGPLMLCQDMDKVLMKMNSDKKNRIHGQPSFTLLKDLGSPEIDCLPSQSEITEALELYIDIVS